MVRHSSENLPRDLLTRAHWGCSKSYRSPQAVIAREQRSQIFLEKNVQKNKREKQRLLHHCCLVNKLHTSRFMLQFALIEALENTGQRSITGTIAGWG